jgi:hypothetical protein
MLHIQPVTESLSHGLPLLDILEGALATTVIESSHSIFFNLILAGKPERVLHLQFNRQTMCIPSCLSRHMMTLHRLIPADSILVETSYHMMDSRAAISCGWTFIENIMRSLFSYHNALVKDTPLLPELKDIFFQSNEVDLAVHLSKHA